MAFKMGSQGLLHLSAVEKAGNTPDTDISNKWTHRTMNMPEKYMVGVGIFMDIVLIILVLAATVFNFGEELREFVNDPTDRLVLAGGYEHNEVPLSEDSKKKQTFKIMWSKMVGILKSKATVPNAYYSRILNKYDQISVDSNPSFGEWYEIVTAKLDAVTKGYVMAGIHEGGAYEMQSETSDMMIGASGFVGAILGDSAQTAAILKTEMGDIVRGYIGEGGQMQTTNVVAMLQDMKSQGLSREEMMKRLKAHAKTEKGDGYQMRAKYEGAAKAAKRRRIERKRRRREARLRNEERHRRPTMSRKSFLKRGEGGQKTKKRDGQPSRRRREKKVRGISVFMK